MARYENIRRIYMDMDDVLYKSSPVIQFHVTKKFPQYSSDVLKLKEGNLLLWKRCRELAIKEKELAKREGRKPIFYLPFIIGKNDIIREDENFTDDYETRTIVELDKYIELANHDLDMYFENRDATLEADGKLKNGVIPYEEIYSEKNWMPYAKENLNDLYNVFGSERLVCLTAHNGIDDSHGREFEAKVEALHRMNPNIKVYGIRFHAIEHSDDGKRRPRNLKSSGIRRIEGIGEDEPLDGYVCPDDSSFNNNDIYDNGGIPVFINPIGAKNERGYAMAKSIRAESLFREFDALHLDGPKDQVLRKRLIR